VDEGYSDGYDEDVDGFGDGETKGGDHGMSTENGLAAIERAAMAGACNSDEEEDEDEDEEEEEEEKEEKKTKKTKKATKKKAGKTHGDYVLLGDGPDTSEEEGEDEEEEEGEDEEDTSTHRASLDMGGGIFGDNQLYTALQAQSRETGGDVAITVNAEVDQGEEGEVGEVGEEAGLLGGGSSGKGVKGGRQGGQRKTKTRRKKKKKKKKKGKKETAEDKMKARRTNLSDSHVLLGKKYVAENMLVAAAREIETAIEVCCVCVCVCVCLRKIVAATEGMRVERGG
jgi:hypothetical protein